MMQQSPTRQAAPALSPSANIPLPKQAQNVQQQQARALTPTRQQASTAALTSSPKSRAEPIPSSQSRQKTAILDIDEAAAAANAAALLGQQSTTTMMDDSDIMLTNVEEMLEGFEWGAEQSQGADQVEKRLLGELNALEAAGIHAIIESDDRVIDVVKYLDNALAEVDRMDQMLSLYKTHLNAVSDDINHIESQNKGLQIQSSNQRALLAELDSILAQ